MTHPIGRPETGTTDAGKASTIHPDIQTTSLSTRGVMMLGFQRTRHISARARKAWEAGDPLPLQQEATTRRDEIISGALDDMRADYPALLAALRSRGIAPKSVIDIGCGQALNDALLARDFDPAFILIDIESTPEQYHAWKSQGSGYAQLAEAGALLRENGARQVRLINPLKAPEQLNGLHAELVISTISCGFHYPVTDYIQILRDSLDRGGAAVLDIRRRYRVNPDAALASLLDGYDHVEIPSMEHKANRLLFTARR